MIRIECLSYRSLTVFADEIMKYPMLFVVVWWYVIPNLAFAQPERYELGQRLKAFEQAWEAQTDRVTRERALIVLPKVTSQFFSFQLGEAGRTLDTARFALAANEPPAPEVFWWTSLYPLPEKRLIDAASKELIVDLKFFYPVKVAPPDVVVRVGIRGSKSLEYRAAMLPKRVTLDLTQITAKPPADLELTMEVQSEGKVVAVRKVIVSQAENGRVKLAELRKSLKERPAKTIEYVTLEADIELLAELYEGIVPETDVFAAKRLARTSELLESLSKKTPYFGMSHTGDQTFSIPNGKRPVPVRLYLPKGVTKEKPVPLVIALHGAGGTENLFFEGYGAGQIVKECEKRNWLLIAPGSGLNFGSGPPVKVILDELAARYPIDRKKIFIVGHSMGAAQTIALCQSHPSLFAGAAALGGGGAVKIPATFAELPIFVGVGTADFALNGSRELAKILKASGAKNLTAKEYLKIEHMAIVREALPDVFAIWDAVN